MAEQKPKKNQAALGCLFWIAFILLILTVFFIKKDTIKKVLDETRFFELVLQTPHDEIKSGSDGVTQEKITVQRKDQEDVANTVATSVNTVQREEQENDSVQAVPHTPESSTQSLVPGTSGIPNSITNDSTSINTAVAQTSTQTAPLIASGSVQEQPKPQKTIPVKLFFINIDADGKMVRKELTRSIVQTDSPLTDTLKALFQGTTVEENKKDLITLIPSGTKIISVTVQNGIATINVSDEFQYNQYGIEGYIGQLMQIVFTATSYSTVNSVQIMIEGQRKEYLGAEGVWIGSPLTRNSF